MFEDNKFLGGHLVGIGKVKANGEVIYNELDKPIHNRITSVGLNHLFQWAGTNDYDNNGSYNHNYLWCDKSTKSQSRPAGRAGALNYMKFGSGTAETSFTDTDLKNSLSSFAETKETLSTSGQKLNGTRVNSFGNYSMRISHRSDAVSETTTVNEIGWFGGYTNAQQVVVTPGDSSTTMVMFSRVVLPSPIVLEAGESLITTYQLDMTVANTTASVISDFFGLKDANGNTLQAEHKVTVASSGSSSSDPWGASISIMDYIAASGSTAESSSYQGQHVFHAFNPVVYNSSYYLPLAYSTTVNAFPQDGKLSSLTNTYTSTVGTTSYTLENYTGTGSTNKYRDRTFVLGQYWPNMSDPAEYVDITYLLVSGHAYRFGYYDNGTWVPQALRKYANQQITLTSRTRFSTNDTTLS